MLNHSLRRSSVIETALGYCTVFSECCSMLVTFKILGPETPDNTIHWPNAEVIPTKTLSALIIDFTTNIMMNIIISEHLLKTKVLKLMT